MKVADLIEILKTFDPELPVAIPQWSENVLLEEEGVSVAELCEDRGDGWIANKRPDKPTIKYLVIG